MGLSQFDEIRPHNQGSQVFSTDGSTNFQLMGQTPYFKRIDRIIATNGDTIDHTVTITMAPDSGAAGIIGSFTIAAGVGLLGSAPLDVLVALGLAEPSLVLYGDETLYFDIDTDVVGSGSLYLCCFGGEL